MHIKTLGIFFALFHQLTFSEQRFSFPKEFDQECTLNVEYDLDAEMEILKKESFIAVSLGENCFPALHMREHNIRIRSFPFDWNITPATSLYALIENDFDGFLDFENFAINKKENTIFSKQYHCKLNHDFAITDWANGLNGIIPKDNISLENYKKVISYYYRRVARFYCIFTLNVPIYLFRRVISALEAIRLHNLLKTKFPQSNFTLICIQDKDWESTEKWKNLPGIVYFKMLKPENHTIGKRNVAWTNVFLSLGLIKS